MIKRGKLTPEQKLALGYEEETTIEETIITNEEEIDIEKKQPVKKKKEVVKKKEEDKTSSFEDKRNEFLKSIGEEVEETPVKTEVNIDDLLSGLSIDVSNIDIVQKTDFELFTERNSLNINGKSTFETVCNQSAYVAHMESLKYSDLSSFENSTGSYFAGRQRLIKTIYSKVNTTSIGKLSYEDFLKITSFYDLPSLIFGAYCQSFKTDTKLTINCPHCKEGSTMDVPNKHFLTIKNEEVYSNIQEILSSVTNPQQAMDKSLLSSTKRFVLPISKTILEIKIPSLYKYLEIIGSVKQDSFEKVQDILGALLFVEKVYQLDVAAVVKANGKLKKAPYYEIKDREKIASLISNMEIEDTKVLKDYVNDLTEKYAVEFAIKPMDCPKCKKRIETTPIDMEALTFFRLEQI